MYELLIENNGTQIDTYHYTVEPGDFPIAITNGTVTILPTQHVVIPVTVTVPISAKINTVDVTTITVRSTTLPTITAHALISTYIVDAKVQLCIAFDASGSVTPSQFILMRDGLAAAIRAPTTTPRTARLKSVWHILIYSVCRG